MNAYTRINKITKLKRKKSLLQRRSYTVTMSFFPRALSSRINQLDHITSVACRMATSEWPASPSSNRLMAFFRPLLAKRHKHKPEA